MSAIALPSRLTGMWVPARSAGGRRVRSWSGTPEVFFHKEIDNSRLVRVADRARNREMALFAAALGLLFLLVMVYAWQHFSAREYGYRVEALAAQRDTLVEANRALRLEQASYSDPARIDALARKMGLRSPQPEQVAPLDSGAPEGGATVMAQAAEIAVVARGD